MKKAEIVERLRCTTKTTEHYKTVQITVRTFSSLRRPIIRQINKFFDETSMQEDGPPLRLSVKKSEGRPSLNGVFTVDGLAGMIEAADIKKLDMISPFIGALLYLICGESESFPVTKVFTEYMGVMNKVCSDNGREKWRAAGITELIRDIKQFKVNRVTVFIVYQKSEM